MRSLDLGDLKAHGHSSTEEKFKCFPIANLTRRADRYVDALKKLREVSGLLCCMISRSMAEGLLRASGNFPSFGIGGTSLLSAVPAERSGRATVGDGSKSNRLMEAPNAIEVR